MAEKTELPKLSFESSYADGLCSLEEKLPKEDSLFFSRVNWTKKENSENTIPAADGGLKRIFFFYIFSLLYSFHPT